MKYPAPRTASPLIECPVHGCVVVLGDDGRIKTCCPMCLREAKAARRKLKALR